MRTVVLSNICTTAAVRLHSANAWKNASRAAVRDGRQKRFPRLVQGPNQAGSARRVMLSTEETLRTAALKGHGLVR
ncbi:MAG: hypothetical protein N3D18_11590 [Roseococcus sp.]|nr:hypothetical protein [Roseococcus sp.]